MTIRAPNWRAVVALRSTEPTEVELAHLDLYAQSEAEAYSLTRCFLSRDVVIISLNEFNHHGD